MSSAWIIFYHCAKRVKDKIVFRTAVITFLNWHICKRLFYCQYYANDVLRFVRHGYLLMGRAEEKKTVSHFEKQCCVCEIRPVRSSPCGIQQLDSLGIPFYKTFHHLRLAEHYFYAVLLTVCRCESSGSRVKCPDINSTRCVTPPPRELIHQIFLFPARNTCRPTC